MRRGRRRPESDQTHFHGCTERLGRPLCRCPESAIREKRTHQSSSVEQTSKPLQFCGTRVCRTRHPPLGQRPLAVVLHDRATRRSRWRRWSRHVRGPRPRRARKRSTASGSRIRHPLTVCLTGFCVGFLCFLQSLCDFCEFLALDLLTEVDSYITSDVNSR